MKSSGVIYWTGFLGMSLFGLDMLVIPLYFIYDGVPPAWNILTRTLMSMLAGVALIGFSVGLRGVISKSDAEYEWVGTLVFSIGLAYALTTFVADAIQLGSVWGSKQALDPTLVGSGGEGALLLYGPMARLLTAVFLIASGAAILRTRLVAAWLGWLAYGIGAIHLLLVPSLFFMSDPSIFIVPTDGTYPSPGASC
jgi:hypothetical protein